MRYYWKHENGNKYDVWKVNSSKAISSRVLKLSYGKMKKSLALILI